MTEKDVIKMGLEFISLYERNIETWKERIKLYPVYKTFYEKQISIDEKCINDIIEQCPKIKKYLNLL